MCVGVLCHSNVVCDYICIIHGGDVWVIVSVCGVFVCDGDVPFRLCFIQVWIIHRVCMDWG